MESIQTFSLVLSIVAILMWIVTMPLLFMAWIELKTFMKSTHKVEWMPYESQIYEKPKKKDKKIEVPEMSDIEKTFREMQELEAGIEIPNFP